MKTIKDIIIRDFPEKKDCAKETDILVCLTSQELQFGSVTASLPPLQEKRFARSARADSFEGKKLTSLCLLAPEPDMPESLSALCVFGVGDGQSWTQQDFCDLGGTLINALPTGAQEDITVRILLECPYGGKIGADPAAHLLLGCVLGAYRFERYKTVSAEKDKQTIRLELCVPHVKKTRSCWKETKGLAEGVLLARDLVNQPANVMTTNAFVQTAETLSSLGIRLDVLGRERLESHAMGALLAVAQGAQSPPYLITMEWCGGDEKTPPVALVGKGVVFDSGGLSLKPAANMEAMKGDMAGAAAVIGTMHALAKTKLPVNVVGIIAVVENMPSGHALRPGDIITSLSGQTIEVLNTDAEGRLILADALSYVQSTYNPRLIVDLATLTGAIMVALGQYHAGLFSNNDTLAGQLEKAGNLTGEKCHRMPLDAKYDEQLKSQSADMKNIGGRYAGAITAAQFLKRFIENETPWAHLDIAGVAMESPETPINKSWASGFGVRLLQAFLMNYEL